MELGEGVEESIAQAARKVHLRRAIRTMKEYRFGRPGDVSALQFASEEKPRPVSGEGPPSAFGEGPPSAFGEGPRPVFEAGRTRAADALWRHLQPADRCELIALGSVRTLADGEPLFRAQDESLHVHVVLTGWVRLSSAPERGTSEVTVAVRSAGDVVGEAEAVCGTPRTTTATAKGEVSLLTIHAELFLSFLRAQPAVVSELEAITRQRMRAAKTFRRGLEGRTGVQRLAFTVLTMAERLFTARGVSGRAPLPADLDDLAAMAGLPVADVCTILGEWTAGQVVRLGGDGLTILDPGYLCAIVRGDTTPSANRTAPDARRPDGQCPDSRCPDGEPLNSRRDDLAVAALKRFGRHQAEFLRGLQRLPQDAAL